jgi:hypothetical protein
MAHYYQKTKEGHLKGLLRELVSLILTFNYAISRQTGENYIAKLF